MDGAKPPKMLGTDCMAAMASPAKCAARIYRKVQSKGTQQVRLFIGWRDTYSRGQRVQIYRPWLLTYPSPAPAGYGTRGELIGIYGPDVSCEWIEQDLLSLASEILDDNSLQYGKSVGV